MYYCLLLKYKDEIIYGFAVCIYINCADGSKIVFSFFFFSFFFFGSEHVTDETLFICGHTLLEQM